MYHLLVLLILCSAINGQQEVFLTNYEWGTTQDEFITSAAYHTQSDVIYTAGYTYGNMQGTNKGSTDVVVSILPLASGPLNVQWGTPWEDRPTDIVYDIKRNLIHVVGWTSGVLAGDKSAGVEDGFITTLTVQGPSATTDHYQWGTAGSDKPMCAAVDPQDATTIYVAGTTSGAFTGYSNKGSEDVFVSVKHANNSFSHYQWGTKAVDVVGDCVFDTTTGVFYIVGSTVGALPGFNNSGGYDPFATVLLRNGEIRHIQWGTAYSEFVTGAVYNTRLKALMVVGYTNGAFTDTSSRGAQDAFLSVISFKDDGSYSISDHQWGTIGNDVPTDVSTDIVYNRIYVSGYTSGQFTGATSAGGTDAFMSVFAAANPEYPPNTFQWGTNGTDQCVAIAQSSSNPNVYCAGWTTGGFPTSQGVTGGTQLFASGLRKELLPTPFVEESSSEPDGLISNSNRVQTNFVLFGVVMYIYYLL